MTEQEAIDRIHSVYPTGKKNGLENMRALMAKLGNVQEQLLMIHVAGTNGKGSCCAMLERMLREAGYKTGLYSSPYIEVYNERIRLNGVPVDGDTLAHLVETVWPAVEACLAEGIQVTEFEVGTALAFVAFHEAEVDAAIIEVGLGGRLDPTNIITPAVSVITNIGRDHMQYLGNTIEEIALEKAGIMKRGVPVVLGAQERSVRTVLAAAAKGLGCPLVEIRPEEVVPGRYNTAMRAALSTKHSLQLTVGLPGVHQADNAAAALGVIRVLRSLGMDLSDTAVREGLLRVRWPGRLEYFGQVLLDGAHNDPGVRALCAYCDLWLPPERTVLITGMMKDKETEGMAEHLSTRVSHVICAQPKLPRALDAGSLAEMFHGVPTEAIPDAGEALARGRELAGKKGIVLCAGSLYLIGELRSLLRQEKEFQYVV